jgi:hypothetical protein
MITARLLALVAASSLAGIAYAQTQPAPSSQPNAPPGYNTSNPHQSQMKSAPGNEAASPGSRPAPGSALNTPETGNMAASHGRMAPGSALNTAASSQRNHAQSMKLAEAGPGGGVRSWANLPVESSSGHSLGTVSKVVPGLNGQRSSGYVLVSGSHGKSVPVPYPTAHAMVRGGKLVLNKSRFEHAPKVTRAELRNRADRAWRIKADRYWMHSGHQHMHQ